MRSLFEWRHQYDVERDATEGYIAGIEYPEESLTIQDAPDADINQLMARMGINDYSQIPADFHTTVDPGYYGDFTDIPDLATALSRVAAAKEKFAQLPAKLRARFHNDPWELHTFVNDRDNHEEAIQLGLLTRPKPTPEPTPIET